MDKVDARQAQKGWEVLTARASHRMVSYSVTWGVTKKRACAVGVAESGDRPQHTVGVAESGDRPQHNYSPETQLKHNNFYIYIYVYIHMSG